jgi:hypothetical protein
MAQLDHIGIAVKNLSVNHTESVNFIHPGSADGILIELMEPGQYTQ